MAQIDFEEHLFSEDEIYVSKDDGTKGRRFTERDEAEEYYEYLKREEVQDSIAKNQAEAVAQNKEIIANQERLIKSQERNHPYPHQTFTRQILDPEYREWIRFQKETDPKFKKWKREQEEALAKQEAARKEEERKRREKEIEEQRKKEMELFEKQKKIAPLVSKYLQGEKLTWQQRREIAYNTNNSKAINKLKYDHSQNVVNALLCNPYISSDIRSHIFKRKEATNVTAYSTSQQKDNNSTENGCIKFLMIWSIIIIIVTIISLTWGFLF
jgi:hypothetical protein